MTEQESLAAISEPNRIEIIPGLVLEDKLRIKTQRKLENYFKLPMSRIFPGKFGEVSWEGVNFNFLNNTVPLLTILAQQLNEELVEADIENLLDGDYSEEDMANNMAKFFNTIKSNKPKNRKRSNRKKRK